MTDKWPEDPEDQVDPAFAPLIEAGEGESEGFDVAEADLITRDAAGFDSPVDADLEEDPFEAADAGEGDEEEQPD